MVRLFIGVLVCCLLCYAPNTSMLRHCITTRKSPIANRHVDHHHLSSSILIHLPFFSSSFVFYFLFFCLFLSFFSFIIIFSFFCRTDILSVTLRPLLLPPPCPSSNSILSPRKEPLWPHNLLHSMLLRRIHSTNKPVSNHPINTINKFHQSTLSTHHINPPPYQLVLSTH